MRSQLALLDRGWVEKILPNGTNLDQSNTDNIKCLKMSVKAEEEFILSSFLEPYDPNLIWGAKNFKNN